MKEQVTTKPRNPTEKNEKLETSIQVARSVFLWCVGWFSSVIVTSPIHEYLECSSLSRRFYFPDSLVRSLALRPFSMFGAFCVVCVILSQWQFSVVIVNSFSVSDVDSTIHNWNVEACNWIPLQMQWLRAESSLHICWMYSEIWSIHALQRWQNNWSKLLPSQLNVIH